MIRARSKAAAAAPAAAPKASNTRYRLCSIVLWCAACYTTWRFLDALAPGTPWLAAVVVQAVFTVIESDFFKGQRNIVTVAATAVDSVINAGGLWVYTQHVDRTQSWEMVQAMSNTTGGVSALSAGILALLLGVVLAAAPERMWR